MMFIFLKPPDDNEEKTRPEPTLEALEGENADADRDAKGKKIIIIQTITTFKSSSDYRRSPRIAVEGAILYF